jgi:ABC-type uncharacterized transport system ATPase component
MENYGHRVTVNELCFNPFNDSKKGILNNVSFSVEPGEFVSIIGRNGHGKTSLIRAIAGEIENEFKTGEVMVGITRINGPINTLISGVGIVHQFVQYDLIDELSIAKNLQIRQLFSLDRETRKLFSDKNWIENTNKILSKFITDKEFTPNISDLVCKLSGGQKQLLNVLIAARLEHSIMGCDLLLLDEHLTSLDVIIRKKVMNLIDDFTYDNKKKKRKSTIIMVTHYFDYALKYSDKIIALKNGVKVDEILKMDKIKWNESYLESIIE